MMNSLGLFALMTLHTLVVVQGFQGGLTPRRPLLPASLGNICSVNIISLSGSGVLSLAFSSSKARVPSTRCFATPQDEETIKKMLEGVEFDGEVPEIVRLDPDASDIDGSVFENIETGQPTELMVMKELLGINIFTYILGGLIVVFLSLNFFLGPGWLGQAIGLQGTGTFEEVSKSLPDTVDLSRPEFRLDL